MNSGLTLSKLKDKGYKITVARKKMVDILAGTKKPLSAKEILAILKRKGLSVNKTTVYRELQFLIDEGFLKKIHLNPEETSYEPEELIHHHHLVCEVCGRIDSITDCLAEKFEDKVFKKKGFKIKKHNLEFYGACSRCIKKN